MEEILDKHQDISKLLNHLAEEREKCEAFTANMMSKYKTPDVTSKFIHMSNYCFKLIRGYQYFFLIMFNFSTLLDTIPGNFFFRRLLPHTFDTYVQPLYRATAQAKTDLHRVGTNDLRFKKRLFRHLANSL